MGERAPRMRALGGAGKQSSTLVCPRVSLAEGIRITIQFIHSRPFTYLPLYPHSSYTFYHCLHLLTPSILSEANQPTTHPLSHIITRPLWKCVSLPLDIPRDERGKIPRANERGLVQAHPSYTLLLIHFTTNASVRREDTASV